MRLRLVFTVMTAVVALGARAEQSPDFVPCFTSQQTAITDLIQALKDAKKVIGSGSGGSNSNSNPFKDKQQYNTPELKKDANPEAKLEQLRQEQEKLVDGSGSAGKAEQKGNASGSGRGEQQEKQAAISDQLEKMSGDKNLAAEIRKTLKEAAASGRAAEKALAANEAETARDMGAKTLAEMRKALMDIRARSDNAGAATTGEIRKELNRAGREAKSGNRAGAETALDNIRKQAAAAAGEQLKSGSFANAVKFNNIAHQVNRRMLSSGGISTPNQFTEVVETLRREINAALRQTDAVRGLREASERLQSIAREFKYRAKQRTTEEEWLGLNEDFQVTVQSVGDYFRELAGKNALAEPDCVKLAEGLMRQQGKRPADAVIAAVGEQSGRLGSECAQLLTRLTSARAVTIFSPDEAPAEYRDAVGKYFESLSESTSGKGARP